MLPEKFTRSLGVLVLATTLVFSVHGSAWADEEGCPEAEGMRTAAQASIKFKLNDSLNPNSIKSKFAKLKDLKPSKGSFCALEGVIDQINLITDTEYAIRNFSAGAWSGLFQEAQGLVINAAIKRLNDLSCGNGDTIWDGIADNTEIIISGDRIINQNEVVKKSHPPTPGSLPQPVTIGDRMINTLSNAVSAVTNLFR